MAKGKKEVVETNNESPKLDKEVCRKNYYASVGAYNPGRGYAVGAMETWEKKFEKWFNSINV
jgi:hypothetical protein